MRKRESVVRLASLGAAALLCLALCALLPAAEVKDIYSSGHPPEPEPPRQPAVRLQSAVPSIPSPTPVTDEPAARALYDQTISAYRAATTLYYEGQYEFGPADGAYRQNCTYRIWLKKPNYVRMEASQAGKLKGVLIGDGQTFWTYWPDGRPQHGWEREGERLEAYERTRLTSYMTKPAPPGGHSISHDAGRLNAAIAMLIFDPSTFHGYTDSMQQYIDGVRSVGVEKAGDEECDVIHLSLMKGQREWRLWISKADHLPRRFHEWVHVRNELTAAEEWTNLALNADIPDAKFAWRPPAGWTEYRMPEIEEGLLKPGTPAPDFELKTSDGQAFRLSDHRGKVVWIFVWRAG